MRRGGHAVFWPVHVAYHAAIQAAAPRVRFLPQAPVPAESAVDFLYHRPLATLQNLGCERIFPLVASYDCTEFIDGRLLCSLKFDEYKYAVARVPFAEKWALSLTRDVGREKALHAMLGITRPYLCVDSAAVVLPAGWAGDFQIVPLRDLTGNPLDWLHTLEHAAKRVVADGVYATLIEQLVMPGDNYLIAGAEAVATPVYRHAWIFCTPGQPIPAGDWLRRKIAL